MDYIDGGDGDDHLGDNGGGDTLLGGAGNDSISAGYGVSVDGGVGTDRVYISFYGAGAGITADFRNLTNGGALAIAGAALTGIEYVHRPVPHTI